MKPYPIIRRSGSGAHCRQSVSFGSLDISTSGPGGSHRASRRMGATAVFELATDVDEKTLLAEVAKSAGKKIADGCPNFRRVGLQREMPRIKETHDRVRDVALESLGPLRQEERIILAPHRQKARLVGAEIFLEGGVERDVALIVPKQVQLQLGRAGPSQ